MIVFKPRNGENYWREKIAAFLHDPPDKALSIADHVKRSKLFTDELHVSPEELLVDKADQVASGLDRTFLPDSKAGGFVDFKKNPVITHPTGKNGSFSVPLNTLSSHSEEVLQVIRQDENNFPKAQPERSFALFHYLRHVLPYRLATEGPLGLTWQWERLPADTRIPDHTIWQHCALTSALYSCYSLSRDRRASLMVFSITPVQDFISRSRKLRDYWISSLLLSWLAAEGMKVIILQYGSDHIVYPWPVGQPLIERMLDGACNFPSDWRNRYSLETRAATLPNKFVCLVPSGEEENIAEEIEKAVLGEWLKLANSVRDFVKDKSFKDVPSRCTEAFDDIFKRQVEHFWELNWSAAPLLDDKDLNARGIFVPQNLLSRVREFVEEGRETGFPYLNYDEKFFYPLSHDLCQRGLAAEKLTPENVRAEEPGIKCHLHTDFEALRFSCLECRERGETCELDPARKPDPNPRPSVDPCWKRIREAFSESEFKETERLSAVAIVKRMIYRVVEEEDHPLYPYFRNAVGFPSTTEVSAQDWLRRAKREIDESGLSPRKVAEVLHREESPKSEWNEIEVIDSAVEQKVKKVVKNRSDLGDPPDIVDRYYALLVMDGDRMGKLLAGGFSSTWRDVLHPELVKGLQAGKVDRAYVGFWKKHLEVKRILSPAVHGAISQALAEFSLRTVPFTVKAHDGRLIYAGGDDVCAVFPVSGALRAALEIAKAYNWGFVRIPGNGVMPQEVSTGSELRHGDRLILHLGSGEEISISAGLLIVHHKWPLRSAIRRAHELLELAKDSVRNGSDRAAMAVSLHRRAGGERVFIAGFRDLCFGIRIWDAFLALVEAIAAGHVGASFLYGLSEIQEGLLALESNSDDLVRLIRSQMEKSGIVRSHSADRDVLARNIAALILGGRRTPTGKKEVSTEVLEICEFVARAVKRKTTGGKVTESRNE
ncbi:type III-B CRISPR-associated protein Cas10/Cmr2 [Thermodesulforhabdus norvegica]|uniref:CRISPR-associated protein Cmr2 n=1 Tax=Thermodesulforhabdus norvegica TaxID=39841 RepID=A0A1I4TAU1_9BACT|nr:type III-B CRISPR-associated protein Cas10/Cmr2 [Thermodesulforhabdus norvegica]SFM73680.1 CRISPR-associated protein Cmr2 [Thermodesulforhabdus norvegica]